MNILKAGTTRYRCGGVLVKFTKVLTELTVDIDIKTSLVAEEHYSSGRDKASQVVLLCICKLSKVDAMYFGANLRVAVENVGSVAKEVTELRITLNTSIPIWCLRQGLPMDVRKHWTEIVVFVVVVDLHSGATRLVFQRNLLVDKRRHDQVSFDSLFADTGGVEDWLLKVRSHGRAAISRFRDRYLMSEFRGAWCLIVIEIPWTLLRVRSDRADTTNHQALKLSTIYRFCPCSETLGYAYGSMEKSNEELILVAEQE